MSIFFKKHWYLASFILVLCLAIGVRLYQLGSVPHGMTWDEAAIGYNGYALLTTRRDEWLERLPISFKSFGDYKAPLAIYTNGIFTAVFGMNLMAVRLPFFIASIFAVIGIVFLTRELFSNSKYQAQYSLFAGFLLATSPWHFHYSRTGFESGMALTFYIWGLTTLLRGISSNFKNKYLSIFSAVCFAASLYAYHSAKLVVPLTLLVMAILFFKTLLKNTKQIILPLLAFFGLLLPLVKDSFYGDGLTRAGVSIFFENISIHEKLNYIFNSYLLHFSPRFLLLGQTTTLRHGTGYLGVLFITTLLLIIIALLSYFTDTQQRRYKLFSVFLVLIGILPAAISMEVPHSNRSFLALPGFLLLAVFGLEYSVRVIEKISSARKIRGSHGEKNIIVKSVVGIIVMTHLMLFVSFLSHYFTVFAAASADSFKDGYLEAFEIAQKYENGDGVDLVDKIIFTSDYGQPYIYALFVRKTNPIWYQGGSLIKYEFYDDITISDLARKNALVVGSNQDELPIEQADHIIYGSDGTMRFQIYRTGTE